MIQIINQPENMKPIPISFKIFNCAVPVRNKANRQKIGSMPKRIQDFLSRF